MHDSTSQPPALPARRGFSGPVVVIGVVGLMACLTFGAVVLPTMAARQNVSELPVYGAMPELALKDQTGKTVTRDALRGQVVVANFIFTRCPTVCPAFTMKMRRIQDRTTDVSETLKMLSFSVDPTHDTPAVLAAYAEEYGADPGRWRFLTGPFEDVRRVVSDGLMLAMDEQGTLPSGVPNIIHSEHFALFDHELRIRGYYDASDAKRIERMLRDARKLIFYARQAVE